MARRAWSSAGRQGEDRQRVLHSFQKHGLLRSLNVNLTENLRDAVKRFIQIVEGSPRNAEKLIDADHCANIKVEFICERISYTCVLYALATCGILIHDILPKQNVSRSDRSSSEPSWVKLSKTGYATNFVMSVYIIWQLVMVGRRIVTAFMLKQFVARSLLVISNLLLLYSSFLFFFTLFIHKRRWW